jgi:elongation factor P
MTIKAGNIRKGNYILFKGGPCLVTKTDFISPGKGSAFMRVKFKNIKTQNTQEFTYKSTESVEQIDVSSVKMQFLYMDNDNIVFMNPTTYEQVELPKKLIGEKAQILTPEISVYVLLHDDEAIDVSFPPKISLKVVEAEDATAGNTMGTARKNVKLETGLMVAVPIFVKEGENVIIDTQTLSYDSRG